MVLANTIFLAIAMSTQLRHLSTKGSSWTVMLCLLQLFVSVRACHSCDTQPVICSFCRVVDIYHRLFGCVVYRQVDFDPRRDCVLD